MAKREATMAESEITEAPECVLCGSAFDHGCNSAFCSLMCEEEAELIHERAHAGISEPDDCDRGDSCPQASR